MAKKSAQHLLDELEDQFVTVQKKIMNSKDKYVASHQKEYDRARDAYRKQKKKLEAGTKRVTKKAEAARKSSTKRAQNELKKARAAAVVLCDALLEAGEIMKTAQNSLSTAKPFQKKLAARAKALADFEKEWEKKQKAAEKAKADRARKRKAAAKKK
ncbi:MAG TPA: hypothetical protein DCM54_13410 [Gammaproteobacteria bacterium]|nr:hypothetical protein [Gammaproteobacteria bacterium]|tara:strand:+ start:6490 stop:6960 length:471 start_codon:yes stop_codon:yes gene_type:complete